MTQPRLYQPRVVLLVMEIRDWDTADVSDLQPQELDQAKQAVRAAFFSGDAALIDAHFVDHTTGASTSILGYDVGRLAGIVTIRWHSRYPPFRERGIPLIQYIEI